MAFTGRIDETISETLEKMGSPWVQKCRQVAVDKFNKASMPKWKRLKIQDLQIPDLVPYQHQYIKQKGEGNYYIQETTKAFLEYPELKKLLEETQEKDFGVAPKLTAMVEAFYHGGVVVHVPKNTEVKEPLEIDFVLNESNTMVLDYNIIIAEPNSKITLVMDYHSEQDLKGLFHNGMTKVIAKSGAQVNIIKLQRIADEAHHFDSNLALVEGDASVNWYTIEIGSGISATDFTTHLEERGSQSNLKSIFLGDQQRKIDMSYNMIHWGAYSTSDIKSHGALKDQAYSVFRGMLDLKKGAKKSVGAESETVLLLDKTVRSDALPVLFCEEDDVKANHAASAGQLEENKLYYLMSRGLTLEQAKKLVIEGSFKPIIDEIPVEKIRKIVLEEITRRLLYE